MAPPQQVLFLFTRPDLAKLCRRKESDRIEDDPRAAADGFTIQTHRGRKEAAFALYQADSCLQQNVQRFAASIAKDALLEASKESKSSGVTIRGVDMLSTLSSDRLAKKHRICSSDVDWSAVASEYVASQQSKTKLQRDDEIHVHFRAPSASGEYSDDDLHPLLRHEAN